MLLFISIQSFGQQVIVEDSHEPIVDTIIKISKILPENPVWNYSSLNFSNYPNTSDIDLRTVQNIQLLITQNSSLLLNDTIYGEIPATELMDGGLTFSIVGNYIYTPGKQGDLLLTSDTLPDVKQVIYTENYFLLHENDSLGFDTIAYYTNTYYSFINSSSNERVFEVFNKKRSLKGQTNWEFNGISFCLPCINTNAIPDIQLDLTPNPTSDFTMISFTLPLSSEVTISISNQSNTVNEVLLSDLINEGYNEFQFMTQDYVIGSYTITITTSNGVYSKTLVIL